MQRGLDFVPAWCDVTRRARHLFLLLCMPSSPFLPLLLLILTSPESIADGPVQVQLVMILLLHAFGLI